MESELIAVGLVLIIVAAVLIAAIGAVPTSPDIQLAALRADAQAHALVSQLAARLPR